MLIFNLVPLYATRVPLLLQHGRLDRLLPGDFIAPAFQFILGVSMPFAKLRKRRAAGYWAKRVLGLCSIGYTLDVLMFKRARVWGVLETLGATFSITFPLLWVSFKAKAAALSLLFGGYCLLSLSPNYLNLVKNSPHGGIYALPAWATITLIGSLYGEKLTSSSKIRLKEVLAALSLIALGTMLASIFPATKRLVTPSYTLISSGVCASTLAAFTQIKAPKLLEKLAHLGRYALEAWILQYIYGIYPAFYILRKIKFLTPWEAYTTTTGIILATWITTKLMQKAGLKLKV